MRGTYRVYACCRVTSVASANAAIGTVVNAAAAAVDRSARRPSIGSAGEVAALHVPARWSSGGSTRLSVQTARASIVALFHVEAMRV